MEGWAFSDSLWCNEDFMGKTSVTQMGMEGEFWRVLELVGSPAGHHTLFGLSLVLVRLGIFPLPMLRCPAGLHTVESHCLHSW